MAYQMTNEIMKNSLNNKYWHTEQIQFLKGWNPKSRFLLPEVPTYDYLKESLVLIRCADKKEKALKKLTYLFNIQIGKKEIWQ